MGKRDNKRRKNKQCWNWSWGFNSWDNDNLTRTKLKEQLSPFIQNLQRVDSMVEEFRRGGRPISDLQKLQNILTKRIKIQKMDITLTNPAMARKALYDLCDDLHFEVYSMPDQFPCYLLCVISRHWDGPDLLLDELYLSPRNCFFPYSRFVTLSRNGKNRLFLRLSMFRERLREYVQSMGNDGDIDEECDDILDNVGTIILGSAWYEDQRLAFHTSDVFTLHNFRSAMELVGFILGSDLYKVKTALCGERKSITDFFENVYVNQLLSKLLRSMYEYEFSNLATLEEKAKKAFSNLNMIFSDFLSTTDALQDLERFPLYKIILGFFFNLKEVANRNFWTQKLKENIDLLESNAQECSRDVLSELD